MRGAEVPGGGGGVSAGQVSPDHDIEHVKNR